MATNEVKRKLTAIFSADVEGYSRLMGEDELATVETLTSHKETMRKLIKQYRGRVVDSTGDNLLAEFTSVVDAVQCAVEVQQILKAKNEELPENRKMLFRIGINSGDVIEEGDRIFGDGVNIAARVESLAKGGGISLSGTAYDQLGKKLPLGYEFLGEQAVKNIEKPVRVYRILTEAEAAGKVIGELMPKTKQLRGATIGGLIVLIVVAAALAIWNFYFRPAFEPASMEKMAYPLPDKPSIAVLPFTSLGDDPQTDSLSDAITENIITALSKTPEMFVIASNSVFTYKGKPVKVQQISEDLGVRYVLEGSLQKSGDRLRIHAQLIDAMKGNHLWAERYDRNLKDVFALQDEITMKIIAALQLKLTEGDQARLYGKGTKNLEAYLKVLQSIEYRRHQNLDDNTKARRLAEEAIALDPNYPMAYATLGRVYFIGSKMGTKPRQERRKEVGKAEELAQKALSLDDSLAEGYSLLGHIYRERKEFEKALPEYERAVAFNPNGADDLARLGSGLAGLGRYEEAIQMYKKAIRLNPNGPVWYFYALCMAYHRMGNYEEAVVWGQKAVERGPRSIFAHLRLCAAYSSAGRMEEARAEAAEVLRISPKYSVAQREKRKWKDKDAHERYFDALRKAGLK
ncbi:adenylate/guanylate cyclase domain-containing protein [Thermodesulfobacteriota bacterium]